MKAPAYWGGEIPWVSPKDMKVARLYDSIDHITPHAVKDGARLLPIGSLLMVIRGMILAHSFPVARAERPLAFNQDMKALVVNEATSSEFMLYWLIAHANSLRQLTTDSTHGTKRLPPETLYRVPVRLPEALTEQESIAKSLANTDSLVEELDRLIDKTRDLKQAATQQLLSGRTRLPGFTKNWRLRRLGDHVTYLSHATCARAALIADGTVRYLHYGDVHAAPTVSLDPRVTPMPFVPVRLARRFDRLETGDLVLVDASEDLVGIGKSVEIVGADGFEIIAGLHTITARFHKAILADGFKGYLQFMRPFKSQLERLAAGTKVFASNRSHVSSVEMELPDVDEQTAIATVLHDMAREIAALEARRDKIRLLKQGITQELLTGRIRLGELSKQPSLESAAVGQQPTAHNWQFNEAVVIASLARQFGKEEFPLGRKRYTKLGYLLHRYSEGKTQGYLKKAAGPYNPGTRYGGPEKIALQKGYVKQHRNGTYQGFIAGDKIAEADEYFEKWYGADARQWLEQFRFKKTDELEVLATVDMATEELKAAGKQVSVASVRQFIASEPEWKDKLTRPVFSDAGIRGALDSCAALFASTNPPASAAEN